jgi:hypothetical protein
LSWPDFLLLQNDAAIEEIGIRVVPVDFKDFGDKPLPRPALDMNDHIDGVADAGFDGGVGKFHSALQYTTRKSRKTLLRRIRVNGGQRTGVAGVQELQKIECLTSTNFADIRTGYACGWCEIKNGVLTLIPHPHSGQQTRTFRYPHEAEVVGRVTGVAMGITEKNFMPIEEQARRNEPKK